MRDAIHKNNNIKKKNKALLQFQRPLTNKKIRCKLNGWGAALLPSVNADIEMAAPEMSTMAEPDLRLLHYVV